MGQCMVKNQFETQRLKDDNDRNHFCPKQINCKDDKATIPLGEFGNGYACTWFFGDLWVEPVAPVRDPLCHHSHGNQWSNNKWWSHWYIIGPRSHWSIMRSLSSGSIIRIMFMDTWHLNPQLMATHHCSNCSLDPRSALEVADGTIWNKSPQVNAAVLRQESSGHLGFWVMFNLNDILVYWTMHGVRLDHAYYHKYLHAVCLDHTYHLK